MASETTEKPSLREVVGSNIRVLRGARDMTQEELGHRVEELLGHPWSKQTVSKLENGSRPVDLEELLAVGKALGQPLKSFLTLAWRGDLLPAEAELRLGDPDIEGAQGPKSVPVHEIRRFLQGAGDPAHEVQVLEVTSSQEEMARELMRLHEIGGIRRLLESMESEKED